MPIKNLGLKLPERMDYKPYMKSAQWIPQVVVFLALIKNLSTGPAGTSPDFSLLIFCVFLYQTLFHTSKPMWACIFIGLALIYNPIVSIQSAEWIRPIINLIAIAITAYSIGSLRKDGTW